MLLRTQTGITLSTRQTRTLPTIVLLVLACAPVCYTFVSILNFGVDIPVMDEWSLVVLFERFTLGILSLGDLFEQQNEYRQFFPNLVFVALGALNGWQLKHQMLLSFALACLVSFNVYRLSGLTLHFGRNARAALFCAANLLIFSPMQFENWLQGQQLVYFAPVACLTTGLRIIYSSGTGAQTKLLLCAALSGISTFSAANGALCWVLLPVAFAYSHDWHKLRHRREWLLGWVAGFAVCAWLYLHGLEKPPSHPSATYGLAHPLVACVHFLSVLGGPAGVFRLSITIPTGVLLLALFVRACRRWWLAAPDDDNRHRLLCWLVLGAYSILTAALITLGRSGFGVTQSLSMRYTTYTLYLAVAAVYLLALAPPRRAAAVRDAGRVALLTAALFVLQAPIYLLGVRHMTVWRATQLHAKACVLFINVVPEKCYKRDFPTAENLRKAANALDGLGFLRPGLLASNRVRDFAVLDTAAPSAHGSFAELKPVAEGELSASGWAYLPDRGEPADAVAIAWERPGEDERVFAVADVMIPRGFFAWLARSNSHTNARWEKTFSVAGLPAGPLRLTAWAFDARTGKAYKLAGSHTPPFDVSTRNR